MESLDHRRNPEQIPVGDETMSSALREAGNFHRWTHDWIGPFIDGRVLDVGGGTGNHLRYLGESELVSIDLSEASVADLRQRFRGRSSWRFETGDIADPAIVERLGRETFDTVLSCNVFEHIEEDEKAFEHAFHLLRDGGRLVLVLPAHQALWGDMDRLAGHFRRYDRRLARERLERAGFRTVQLRYVNVIGGIGWFVNNRFFRHRDLSSAPVNGQIQLFDRMVPVLRRLEGARPMPFGQTLICVGQRPDH